MARGAGARPTEPEQPQPPGLQHTILGHCQAVGNLECWEERPISVLYPGAPLIPTTPSPTRGEAEPRPAYLKVAPQLLAAWSICVFRSRMEDGTLAPSITTALIAG